MFTLTEKQAAKIAAMWNEYANDDNNVSAKNAHLVFHDDSEDELEQNGCTLIEIRGFQSKSGNPETFYIDENDVTMAA